MPFLFPRTFDSLLFLHPSVGIQLKQSSVFLGGDDKDVNFKSTFMVATSRGVFSWGAPAFLSAVANEYGQGPKTGEKGGGVWSF